MPKQIMNTSIKIFKHVTFVIKMCGCDVSYFIYIFQVSVNFEQ